MGFEGGAGRGGLRRRCGWLVALALLLPGPALAARLTSVRVGLHAGYARVVLETDAPAAFEVIDAPSATPDEVAVRILATSRAREVKSALAGSPVVALAPQDDGSTLARIRAPGRVRVETQVLGSPPRVVLDLHPVASEAASPDPESVSGSESESDAASAVAIEPALVPQPEPTAAPAADRPTLPDVASAPPLPAETASLPATLEAPLMPAPAPARAEPTPDFDLRSVAIGFALGIGIALLLFALRRRSKASVGAPAPEATASAGFSERPRSPLVPHSEAKPSGEVHETSIEIPTELRSPSSRVARRSRAARSTRPPSKSPPSPAPPSSRVARRSRTARSIKPASSMTSTCCACTAASTRDWPPSPIGSTSCSRARTGSNPGALHRTRRSPPSAPRSRVCSARCDPRRRFKSANPSPEERLREPMRKRIVIAGTSREGLELLPPLESNPTVEVCALVAEDPAAARAELERLVPAIAERLASRVTADIDAALAIPGVVAVVDADASARVRAKLARVRGIQVLPPPLARMLYAFGPADAMSKPDLLRALRESLDSYDLSHDRSGLLRLVLQIAVTATGADRGSLMLWDARERVLRVEVAIGIEDEVIPKIRVQPGEGIAGRAFAAERSILLHGKADRTRFDIVRERDDVESAISAPLAHGGRAIGVLNLSHARHQNQFGASELAFVDELARLDARIIARAEEFHGLVRESQTLRAETDVRRVLARDEPLARRLAAVCAGLANRLQGGVCQLYLRESESETLLLQAASTPLDPLAVREHLHFGQGLPGRAAVLRRAVVLGGGDGDGGLCYAALPLLAGDEVVGVLAAQGERSSGGVELDLERLHAAAEALADELAGALRSARNERDSRRAARLGEVVAALGTCPNEQDAADQITASAVSLLEAQDAVLRLRDGASGRFRIASWSGVGEWRKAALAELERKLATEAMQERRLVRVADLAADPAWSEHAVGVSTAMIAPLLRDGRAIGCLSVLGKVPDDPLLGERFGPSEERILTTFAQHAQVALAGLARTERGDAADPVTGLMAQPALRGRLEAELARSRARGHSLVLALLRADGLDALRDPAHGDAADRVALALAQALRATLRDFDVVARPEPNAFAMLVPEPDGEVPALLVALYRAARDALDKHGDAARALDLGLGYAVFPQDGADADELERVARERRVEAL